MHYNDGVWHLHRKSLVPKPNVLPTNNIYVGLDQKQNGTEFGVEISTFIHVDP